MTSSTPLDPTSQQPVFFGTPFDSCTSRSLSFYCISFVDIIVRIVIEYAYFITRIRTDLANIYTNIQGKMNIIWSGFHAHFWYHLSQLLRSRNETPLTSMSTWRNMTRAGDVDLGHRFEGDSRWFQWGQDFGANLLVPKFSWGKNGTLLGRVFTPLWWVWSLSSNTFRLFRHVPSLERLTSFEVT